MKKEATIAVPVGTLKALIDLFEEAWECSIEGYDYDGGQMCDSAKGSGLVRLRSVQEKLDDRCENCPDSGEQCGADCLTPCAAINALNVRLAKLAKATGARA